MTPGANAAPAAGIEIRLLGAPAMCLPGRADVTLSDKDAIMLAFLALEGPQLPARLDALLWPSVSGDKSSNSRRQLIRRLKIDADQPVVIVENRLSLSPQISIDLHRLPHFNLQGLLDAGELLAGVDSGPLPEVDPWLAEWRSRIRDQRAQRLSDHVESMLQAGRLGEALPLALAVTTLAPQSEHAGRRLMRLHYLRGDRGAALAAFDRLEAVLMDQLGLRPGSETIQLLQTIQASAAAPPLPLRPVPASLMLPPVLVGRDAEIRAMAMAWQQQRPIVLLGEAGMGKSRLLQTFVAGRSGVVSEKARPGDDQTPYAVLSRTLRSVLHRHPIELAPADRRELARICPELGEPWPSKARTDVLWHAVEVSLAAVLDAGLVALVFDDMHACDMATLEALRWLALSPRLQALQMALALRPPPEGSPMAQHLQRWLGDSQGPVRIQLSPLSKSELGNLLASLALPALLDPAVTEHLYRHAGGHPLYTLASLQDALSHNRDVRQARLPDPPSVQALLDARLRELPDSARPLLHVAAIAGMDLNAERAAALLGVQPMDLIGPWAVLEQANVLRAESFTHDLVHEAALRSVPAGVRKALHRQLGSLLADDPAAAPGRVANHLERGERWAQAGVFWHAAGIAARQAGRLAEQLELLDHAARCHAQAGNPTAQFESLLARLDSLLLRHGSSAALAALPALEAITETGLQRLRLHLARTEVLLDSEQHGPAAAAEAARAVQAAQQHPERQAEAHAQLAKALVQCRQTDAALTAAQQAMVSARAGGDLAQQLQATNALAYVHYASGRLAEAVPAQRDAVALAESLGDRAEAAAAQGNLTALLSSIGDPTATHEEALRTRDRHRAIGLADNSTLGIVNHIMLGGAAAYLGFFDEALESLQAALAMAGEQTVTAATAKARLALGNLWLTLGRADRARELMDQMPADMLPGMHMQTALLLARAAEQDGLPARRHWQTLARWAHEHPDPPLVQSAWYEYSFQGEPGAVIERLQRARDECSALGLHGTARALQLREVARSLELSDAAAQATAAGQAMALLPHVANGLSAKCYPPQAWQVIGLALARTGQQRRQHDCVQMARDWLARATARVPPEWRGSFAAGNPVNRQLLAADGGRPR